MKFSVDDTIEGEMGAYIRLYDTSLDSEGIERNRQIVITSEGIVIDLVDDKGAVVQTSCTLFEDIQE